MVSISMEAGSTENFTCKGVQPSVTLAVKSACAIPQTKRNDNKTKENITRKLLISSVRQVNIEHCMCC
jgi:hypothetical protein